MNFQQSKTTAGYLTKVMFFCLYANAAAAFPARKPVGVVGVTEEVRRSGNGRGHIGRRGHRGRMNRQWDWHAKIAHPIVPLSHCPIPTSHTSYMANTSYMSHTSHPYIPYVPYVLYVPYVPSIRPLRPLCPLHCLFLPLPYRKPIIFSSLPGISVVNPAANIILYRIRTLHLRNDSETQTITNLRRQQW